MSKIFRIMLRPLLTSGLQYQCATSSMVCHDTHWRFQQATLIKFSGQAAMRLIHPSAWNGHSRKFISSILHNPTPIWAENIAKSPDSPRFVKCAAARGAGAGEWEEGRTTEGTLLHPAPSCH